MPRESLVSAPSRCKAARSSFPLVNSEFAAPGRRSALELGKTRMPNVGPESELPQPPTPVEAAQSPRPPAMRPPGQDVVSYLRTMARAEPEPAPEPRSPLKALLDKVAGAVRSASAISRPSLPPKVSPAPEKPDSAEAQSAQASPEPPPQVPATFSDELSAEPHAESPPAQIVSASVSAPTPEAVLVPPAPPRPSQPSRLMVWRRLLLGALRSAWAKLKTLPPAIRTEMRVWMRALSSASANLKPLAPLMQARLRTLKQQFSKAIPTPRRAVSPQAAEPVTRKPARPRPRPAAEAASARAVRPEPFPPASPFRSAPARTPEPVPPLSPFRYAPAAAAPQPEPVFAAAPAGAASASRAEPTTPPDSSAAPPRPAALRGEVLPPEPAADPSSRADEPARVITMRPGVRSEPSPAGGPSLS